VDWLGAFTQERQVLWLPKDEHKDSSSWSSPPLVLLRDIHNGLLAKYDWKDSVPPPDQSGERARPGCNTQDGVSQQQEASALFVPQLKKLDEAFHVRDEDASDLPTIPLQKRVTHKILNHFRPFKDLKETFAVVCRAEQLFLRTKQRIAGTVEDSLLRTEMETLESQEEDAPKRVLWYTPMGWLGQIRPHRRDEAWSASLWQTCFATCVGAKIPALAELLLSACG
jgi:hypothetical protein